MKVLELQVFLLASNVGGLGLAGIGIDSIAHRVDAARPAPRWPFGWVPPAGWSPMTVVNLRGAVYDKIQRLSFRFFDDHASGSIINRVTGDVQSLRSFVDLVLIQIFSSWRSRIWRRCICR